MKSLSHRLLESPDLSQYTPVSLPERVHYEWMNNTPPLGFTVNLRGEQTWPDVPERGVIYRVLSLWKLGLERAQGETWVLVHPDDVPIIQQKIQTAEKRMEFLDSSAIDKIVALAEEISKNHGPFTAQELAHLGDVRGGYSVIGMPKNFVKDLHRELVHRGWKFKKSPTKFPDQNNGRPAKVIIYWK